MKIIFIDHSLNLKIKRFEGKINVDIYNICRENTNIVYNDIHSILSALWYGVNQNLNVTRHILKQDITNQRFANVKYNQIHYNNARKGWRSALKDILRPKSSKEKDFSALAETEISQALL